MIRMIVLDLDGTILNKDSKITESTFDYLKKLKDFGYIITIATGRSYVKARLSTANASFANYIITDTGACIYSSSNSMPLLKKAIDHEVIEKLFSLYDDDYSFIDICCKDQVYHYTNSITEHSSYTLNDEVFHIIVNMKDDRKLINTHKKLSSLLQNVEIIIMQDSFSPHCWLEIIPSGCTKYQAISHLAHLLNISNDQIMAFGDGANDIDMLKKVGYGVALENALPAVKAVSKATTLLDHNHDGVINFLKGYLDIK